MPGLAVVYVILGQPLDVYTFIVRFSYSYFRSLIFSINFLINFVSDIQ